MGVFDIGISGYRDAATLGHLCTHTELLVRVAFLSHSLLTLRRLRDQRFEVLQGQSGSHHGLSESCTPQGSKPFFALWVMHGYRESCDLLL